MAVWGDVLYIYGGLIWRDKGCVGSLFAYHLLEGRWEVLHSDSKLSHDYPKGRSHHQMWAQAGRLNIFGGRTPCESGCCSSAVCRKPGSHVTRRFNSMLGAYAYPGNLQSVKHDFG